MKKLLMFLVLALMGVGGMMAQNANRSGFFLELQGGAAFGEVLHYEASSSWKDMSRLKGGAVGSLDFGYRYASSTHFALGGKVGMWANFADLEHTYQIRILPGLRWTSNDFGSNNMSAYISLNTGVGLSPQSDLIFTVPIELGVGINFTEHFYGGIIFNYSVRTSNDEVSYDDIEQLNKTIVTKVNSYPALALRLGYRF